MFGSNVEHIVGCIVDPCWGPCRITSIGGGEKRENFLIPPDFWRVQSVKNEGIGLCAKSKKGHDTHCFCETRICSCPTERHRSQLHPRIVPSFCPSDKRTMPQGFEGETFCVDYLVFLYLRNFSILSPSFRTYHLKRMFLLQSRRIALSRQIYRNNLRTVPKEDSPQIHRQNRNVSRRNTADSTRLGKVDGTNLFQFFLCLNPQMFHCRIVGLRRNRA